MNSQATQVTVDLYFARMEEPLKVRLGVQHLRELEQSGKPYTLPNGIVLFAHPEKPEACAAAHYPFEQAVVATITPEFNWQLFQLDELVCAR